MQNQTYVVCTDCLNPLFNKSHEKVISLIIDYPLWLNYVKNQTLEMCKEVLSRNPACIEYVDEKFYVDLGIKHLTTFEFDNIKLFYYQNKYHTVNTVPMSADTALKRYEAFSIYQIAKEENKWFRFEKARSTQYRNAIIENEIRLLKMKD